MGYIGPYMSGEPWEFLRNHIDGMFSMRKGEHDYWCTFDEYGLQDLSRIKIPSSQKRYVFSKRFVFRVNQDFEGVFRACIRDDKPVLRSTQNDFMSLWKMGYAVSYEAWEKDNLVGGCFGLTYGRFVTMESMFHIVSNASKFAYGQALFYLKSEGVQYTFEQHIPKHSVNYGMQSVGLEEFKRLAKEAAYGK